MQTLLNHLFDPALLDRSVLGATIEQWLLLASALIVTAGVLAGLRLLIRKRLARVQNRPKTRTDAVLLDVLARTRGYFLGVLALYLAARLIGWDDRGLQWTAWLMMIAGLLQAGRWATGLLTLWTNQYRRRKMATDAASVTSMQALGVLGRVAVWAVVGLTLLAQLGVDVTALVAGLGIGGIAIGLATQNILGDLFASLSIVLDRPFVIGDMLAVGDQIGAVEHIGLKSTRLRSLSGEQVVFSNGDLLGSRVRNYQRMTQRRVVLRIGVRYETPAEALRRIPDLMQEAVERQTPTLFERAHFKHFGASSLDFECVYHVLSADYILYMDVQQGVGLDLLARFRKAGIELAFPTQTLLFEQATPPRLPGGNEPPGAAFGPARITAAEQIHEPALHH